MDDKLELFRAALGLPEPWRVVETKFDPAARRLDLYLDFAAGTRFPCPEGDEAACPVHDTTPKTWRHLDFFQHQAYLHARTPRVSCPTHGVRQVGLPWARPGSGFTLLFEALVAELVAEMPVKAVAELVGCDDARLWRVAHHYVDAARARLDLSGVTDVGVDETSAARGQDYISLFVDLNRAKGPRVLYATEGRDAATVERFAADLRAHGGDPDAITDVTCDMSPAFIAGVSSHLTKAQITFDRFHTIQLLTKALEDVRRAEAKLAPTLLKGTRYLWLKRPEHLTKRQKAELEFLTVKHKALATARAYRWRLQFDAFYDQPADDAEAYLARWRKGALRSRLEPLIAFARTVEEHWDGILRWHHKRINTGVLEAINSLVQAAKRRARGYRTKRNLIAMTYLIAGKLDFSVIHT
ncbi:MAG: ISL3 family transposase [Actinomycetota bacterium]